MTRSEIVKCMETKQKLEASGKGTVVWWRGYKINSREYNIKISA